MEARMEMEKTASVVNALVDILDEGEQREGVLGAWRVNAGSSPSSYPPPSAAEWCSRTRTRTRIPPPPHRPTPPGVAPWLPILRIFRIDTFPLAAADGGSSGNSALDSFGGLPPPAPAPAPARTRATATATATATAPGPAAENSLVDCDTGARGGGETKDAEGFEGNGGRHLCDAVLLALRPARLSRAWRSGRARS
ncbi:hypothetical protein DFH06DRAFT_1476042 [Mycena polygramma]|nr:hypothetical protein DFH06DRAFT_1476042 [Mycena polygramma]